MERIPSTKFFRYHPSDDRHALCIIGSPMKQVFAFGGFLALIGIGLPAAAADMQVPIATASMEQTENPCYGCIRDGIYADVSLIDHLEANPDIDDGIKGPQIVAARADIHRLRRMLGPVEQRGTEPCCYSRRPLYIR
jgi:hypothetical protein